MFSSFSEQERPKISVLLFCVFSVVHRDLKPENLLYKSEVTLKIQVKLNSSINDIIGVCVFAPYCLFKPWCTVGYLNMNRKIFKQNYIYCSRLKTLR